MTRISNNKFAAVAGGLLSLAAAGAGVAQETGGDRYARALAEADITARYNVQIEQQLRSQEEEIAVARAADRGPRRYGGRRAVDAAAHVR